VKEQKGMNRLTGTIHWHKEQEELIAKETILSYLHLELSVERTNAFTFDGAGYYYNPETSVVVSIIGYIANIYDIRDRYGINAINDVEILERIYSTATSDGQLSFLDEFDGIYLAVIYDANQGKAYLVQSEFGCPMPLYYTDADGKFVFSTSMKSLLLEADIKREFYMPSVQDFMSYSEIIPNEHTLVKGVEKLVTQRNMIINIRSGKKTFQSFVPKDRTLTCQEAESQLIDSIGNQIKQIARNLRKPGYTLTLTGGWDSNLMLSFLNTMDAHEIKAVTINGGGATNEIPAVEHALKFHSKDKVQHFAYTMQNSIFDVLPNIVWIFEGYMFQSGLFLRYALSQLACDIGSSTVFLGSGADPILNTEMGPGGDKVYEPYPNASAFDAVRELKKTIRILCIRGFIGDIYFAIKGESKENRIRRKCLRSGYRQRYNIQIEYNMKMHELMLNSFGIQGLYPFINRSTVSCAKPLRSWNKDKSLYKQKVREWLGPEISSVLKKSQAVVDTESLYKVNNHWLQKTMQSEFIHQVLPKKEIRRITRNPEAHQDTLLRVLSLLLFEKLILSGAYDAKFESSQMGDTLEQVFSC